MSGIDTPEAAVQGRKAAQAGKQVKYVHYDFAFAKGCDLAPDICLGVPFYNWANVYADAMQKTKDGKYTSEFVWSGVDWQNLSNPTTNMIGFNFGNALGENKKFLEEFIKGMSTGTINLYKGSLKFQDGTEYVKAGAVATDQQIWYLPQLLAGMEGPSK
jgi:simple sugar transport system substrate-binding protein